MIPLTLDESLPVLVTDPEFASELRQERAQRHPNARDEVWEGVVVMPPLPDVEHQIMVTDLALAFAAVINRAAGVLSLAGVNVSDRGQDWMSNYREPDVAVYLADNPAVNHGTHWLGGPDFLVEISSPGEAPRQKLDFYAKINTREVLIVDREPWSLELYRLRNGQLKSAGKSDVANQTILTSTVFPLTFKMLPGTPRPTILVKQTSGEQTWTA